MEKFENDVHFIKYKIVRGIPTKCIFFNPEFKESWSSKYTEIIRNDPKVYIDNIVSEWFLEVSDNISFKGEILNIVSINIK